jgi:putative NADPH-quinone reductase
MGSPPDPMPAAGGRAVGGGGSDGARLLIVSGSARPGGDTGRAVARLRELLGVPSDLADLSGIDIAPFAYAPRPEAQDGFDGLVERMLAARTLLFATPVYWYAMSGRMKTLFDRFTDLLTDRDADARRGRSLAGRDMWMLAVGADPELPPGFEVPFRMSADYLGLAWQGAGYVPAGAREAVREEALAHLAQAIAAREGAANARL